MEVSHQSRMFPEMHHRRGDAPPRTWSSEELKVDPGRKLLTNPSVRICLLIGLIVAGNVLQTEVLLVEPVRVWSW